MPVGKLQAVVLVVGGAELDAACLPSDTVLALTGIEDFSESGGQVSIGGAAPVTYLSVAEAVDYTVDAEGLQSPNTYSMTLAAPAGVAYPEGTRVDMYPRSEQKQAHVLITGEQVPIICSIPHEIAISLDDGIRTPGAGESVEVAVGTDGDMYVTRLLGDEIKVLSAALDVIPLPTPDGLAPGQVVGVTAQGGVRSVFLAWPDVSNHDKITYRVWGDVTSGFTPSASNLLASGIPGGAYTATQAWDANESTLGGIQPGRSYYFRVAAEDVDGIGVPSAEISSSPIQIDSVDIAANAVTADKVLANSLTADLLAATLAMVSTLKIGSRISIDPAEGIKISLLNGGMIQFPSDGSDAVIQAIVRANSLVVDDHFSLYGSVNAVKGGLLLSGGVTAPPVPRVSKNWVHPDTYTELGVSGSFAGLCEADSSTWAVGITAYMTGSIQFFSKTTGSWNSSHLSLVSQNVHGIAKASNGRWAVIVWDYSTTPNRWKIKVFDASWNLLNTTNISTQVNDRITVGADGTTFYVVHRTGTNLYVKPFNSTTYAWGTTVEMGSSSDWSSWAPYGVVCDSAGSATDLGLAGFAIAASTAANQYKVFVFNAAGARQSAKDWVPPGQARGLAWDGTRFHLLSADVRRIWHFAKAQATTAFSITNTRYDSDATGGTHETTPSAAVSYSVPLRTWTSVEVDPPGDDGSSDSPDTIRIYVNNHRQAELAPGVTSALYDTFDLTGASAPTTNGFLGVGAPGQLTSENTDADGSILQFRGDGTFRLGGFNSTMCRGIATVSSAVPSKTTTTTAQAVQGTPTTQGGMTYGTNNLIVPKSGYYRITVNGTFGTNVDGNSRSCRVVLTSTGLPPSGSQNLGFAANPASNLTGYGVLFAFSGLWYIAAGDGVQLMCRQDSGASITPTASLTVELVP